MLKRVTINFGKVLKGRGIAGILDKTRYTNRLGNALKQYYPQALQWFEHRDTVVFCDFLTRWPTLIQVNRVRKATLTTFFKAHNVRFERVIEARLCAIKSASPLTRDMAVITAYQLQAEALVELCGVSQRNTK